MNDKTYTRNHKDHHSGKRINHQRDIYIQIAYGHPTPKDLNKQPVFRWTARQFVNGQNGK